MHISKYLFNLAKTPIGDFIVGIAFGNFSSILPVKKIKESATAIAFWHPKPFWESHILIVPKHPIKSLLFIDTSNYSYVMGMYQLLTDVIKELHWENEEYSTLINGGKRQEVGQLHMHLFKGKELNVNHEISPSSLILDSILSIYPFLSENERKTYISKISDVMCISDLDRIEEYLKLLNNPHACIAERNHRNKIEYPTPFARPSDYSKSLPYCSKLNDILYVDIPKFTDKTDVFEDILSKEIFKDTSNIKGYILDLRKNGGGNEVLAQMIARYFLPNGNYVYGKNKRIGDEGKLVSNDSNYFSNNDNPIKCPIVLLVSSDTASSCERFVALMKCLPNVTLIGSDTWGGSANPKWVPFTINNEVYNAVIPTWRFFLVGSSVPLEESKIKPDIYFDPTSIEIVNEAVKYLTGSSSI